MVRINLKNGYQNKYVNIYSDKKILLIVFSEKRKKIYAHFEMLLLGLFCAGKTSPLSNFF